MSTRNVLNGSTLTNLDVDAGPSAGSTLTRGPSCRKILDLILTRQTDPRPALDAKKHEFLIHVLYKSRLRSDSKRLFMAVCYFLRKRIMYGAYA